MSGPRPVRADRGTDLTCLGWPQEAAYRMMHNNLDPEVAERPQDLVVYGGTGKAARELAGVRQRSSRHPQVTAEGRRDACWFRSGKPVGIFKHARVMRRGC